jgi:hypothetical protein
MSVSQTRPDTCCLLSKYILSLLNNLEQHQPGYSISFSGTDQAMVDELVNRPFPPQIVEFESLFIPVSYDSALKIKTVDESFPVERYVEMAHLQEHEMASDILLALEEKQRLCNEEEATLGTVARDEQALLASIKGIVDKLNEDRQAMQIKRTLPSTGQTQPRKSSIGNTAASSTVTNPAFLQESKSYISSPPVISSSSRIGGMVAPTGTDLKNSDLSEYSTQNLKVTPQASTSFGSTVSDKKQSSSKVSATLPHDPDDMSAKIAKLLVLDLYR